MTRFRFSKQHRLLKSADFDRVFRQRVSDTDGVIILYADRNDCQRPRLGLTVSRKLGNAVVRNRWKRLLREAFRLVQDELPRDLDLVVLPRRGAAPDVGRLQASFVKLAGKLAKRLNPAGGDVGKTL